MIGRIQPMSIRRRVLMISLLPLLLLALVLGSYFIGTRIDDVQNSLLERGQSMSRLLASASEFGLMTGNHEVLRNLGQRVSLEPDVADVIFLDNHFQLIQRTRDFALQLHAQGPRQYRHAHQWYFLQPVRVTGISFQDFPEYPDTGNGGDTVGWVLVVLSEEPTLARQRDILLGGLLLMLITVLLTYIIARRFGRRITNPIQGLSRVVERLQDGQLDTRADVTFTGELQTLARGINRMAARIQESKQVMESRVDTATKRLRSTLKHLETKNHELEAARRKADAANQAKDEFLARMSHELRTPMTSVLGFARLLDQSGATAEQREYTRIINHTSQLLLTIIDDILDLSKLESNAIRLEQIPFDPESLLLEVLEMQAPLAHAKGLELILRVSPGTPAQLLGDPTRLRQIVTNLVGNAVKFTATGEIQVFAEAVRNGPDACTLNLRVSDSGIGIPADQVDELFQAFTQADTSITRRFGGSGLGLVITRKLAELMGGKIQLSSQPSRGTDVQLSIPFPCPAVAPEPDRTVPDGVDPILLFDPHPLMRDSVLALLQRRHLRVDLADSFSDFCMRAEQYPALIWGQRPCADSSLPRPALRSLRQHFSGRLLILCSSTIGASGDDADTVILHKPVRPAVLFQALGFEQEESPAATPETTPQLTQGLDLLVAEDNDFNRLLITRILERAGLSPRQARSGVEVMREAAVRRPDLVLMDVHMPEMDGIEATRRLRERWPDLPIIALTANVVRREHQALLQAGISKILLKPIDEAELLDSIQQHSAQRLHRSAPADGDERLRQLDIGTGVLQQEIRRQLAGCLEGFHRRDKARMRHHAHQLLGVAGLYDLPELEAATAEFHQSVETAPMKTVWQCLWRLQRLIEHQPLAADDLKPEATLPQN